MYYGTFVLGPLLPYLSLLVACFAQFDRLDPQPIRFNRFCAISISQPQQCLLIRFNKFCAHFHKSAPTMLFYQYIVKIQWMRSYSASMILFRFHFLYITPPYPIIPFPCPLCIFFKGSKFHRDALSSSIILISFPVHIYIYTHPFVVSGMASKIVC